MAEQFGIRLSVSPKDLLTSINTAIDNINNSGALHNIKLGADTSKLDSAIKRLKTELQSITGKSIAPKIELGTARADGQITLDEFSAFKKAEEALANPTGLTAVQAELGKTAEVVKSLTSAVAEFKAEYAGITGDNIKALREQYQGLAVDIANTTKNAVGGKSTTTKTKKNTPTSGTDPTTEILKEQQQEFKNVAKASEDAARRISEAEKRISAATENTNNLLKVRDKVYAGTSDIYTSETSGDSVNKITKNYINGKINSTVSEVNLERQRKQLEQNYATAKKLASELENVKAKYADVNGQKPITNSSHLKDLKSHYNSISETISKIPSASAEMVTRLKADTESQIAELERLVRQYKNVEYAATSLRTKDIKTIKSQQSNEIEKFTQKILQSGVPLEEFKSKITGLKISLSKVTDTEDLVRFLNKFDVLKSKFDAVNESARTTADITKQIEKGVNGLDRISNNPTLYRNRNYNETEYNNLISSVDALKTKYIELQNSLQKDSSAKNLAKVKEELAGLDEKLKEIGRSAANLKSNLGTIKIDENITRKVAETQALIADIVRKNAYAMGKENTVSDSGLTFGQEFKQLRDELEKFPNSVDSINSKVKVLQANIKTLGYEGNTLLGEMKDKALKFVKWTGMTLFITKARMYIRQLFTTVYELDTALIDLRKTFKGTSDELEDFYFEANKLAKQMGVTTQEIIQQGSAWSRLNL